MYKNNTRYAGRGRWRDGNLVRWVDGNLQPMGGWRLAGQVPAGTRPIRAIKSWRAINEAVWHALGALGTAGVSETVQALYIADEEFSTLSDVTPPDLTWEQQGSFGYGAREYGRTAYGFTPPTSITVSEDNYWSMDNWGQDLLALHSADSRLWQWTPPATPQDPIGALQAVAGAPLASVGVIVTDERHCLLLGAEGITEDGLSNDGVTNPRRIRWCSRENLTQWFPEAGNTAGGIDLETEGRIIGGVKVKGGILILTDVDAHLLRYTGSAFQYGVQRLGSAGLLGPHAIQATPFGAVWMGTNHFYVFDGTVRQINTDVDDWVFSDINRSRWPRINSMMNKRFSEVWWSYPSESSTEPNRYVIFAFDTQGPHWNAGYLARTAWAGDEFNVRPIATDVNGNIWLHEIGYSANGQSRNSEVWAEAGPMEIGQGDRNWRVQQVIQDAVDPDSTADYPFTLTFKVRQAPAGPETIKGPYTMNKQRGYTDVRFRGRQFQLRLDQTEDDYWEMGDFRLRVKQGGAR